MLLRDTGIIILSDGTDLVFNQNLFLPLLGPRLWLLIRLFKGFDFITTVVRFIGRLTPVLGSVMVSEWTAGGHPLAHG